MGTALLNPLSLLFFAAAVATQVVYCALRSVTYWKTVLSGVMVGFGGVAGWVAVAPLRWSALAVFVFLACWEIGGRNIVNDLSDLESDARVGIRTVASVRGEAAAARAAAAVAAACLRLDRAAAHAPDVDRAGACLRRLVAGLAGGEPAAPAHAGAGGLVLQPRQPVPRSRADRGARGARAERLLMRPAGAGDAVRRAVRGPRRGAPDLEPAHVAALFDRNVATYDRVNTIITFGLDARWRRWAARQAAPLVAGLTAAARYGRRPAAAPRQDVGDGESPGGRGCSTPAPAPACWRSISPARGAR